MKPSPPDAAPLALRPDGLDADGAAVARHADLRIHVAGALPGEEISARLVHLSPHRRAPDAPRDAWAELAAITTASPARVPPACPAHGRCGGCVLQHLAYPAQLAWKQTQVGEALATALSGAAPQVAAAVASPRTLGYRNQSKYVVGGKAGALTLGAYAPRSHDVIDLSGCRIGEAPQDAVAAALSRLASAAGIAPFDERRRTGTLRHVVVRTNAAGEALVALVTGRADPAVPALAAELRRTCPAVVGVVENRNDAPGNVIFGPHETLLDGQRFLRESCGGVAVELGARAFLQLNREVATLAYAAIRTAVAALGADAPVERLIDVYSGVGAIAFALADLAREIVAIEENPAATAAGGAAAARAGLTHLRFVTAPAAAAVAAGAGADVVVLNPPRAGAGAAVIAAVAAMRPRLIAYLSCNPSTLARDLAALTAADPMLVITSVQPFDMLPHTTHIETLALVRRAKPGPGEKPG